MSFDLALKKLFAHYLQRQSTAIPGPRQGVQAARGDGIVFPHLWYSISNSGNLYKNTGLTGA
mgnify:CR=1 FL=1